MNDIIQLFNLKEEDIEKFHLSTESNQTKVAHITLLRKDECCPVCGCANVYIDKYIHRRINHPVLNGFKCFIDYRCRRYRCTMCNKTFNENNPFVSRYSGSTKYTKLRVLEMLKDPHSTFTSVAESMNLSITKVSQIFDSLGKIKRLPLPKVLCIDELHDPCSGIGIFDCVFMDFETGHIVDVLPDRTKNYLHHYFQNFTKTECSNVEHISIDMWFPYKQIAQIYFPKAKISVDSFHVTEHISNALKSVRNRVKSFLQRKSNEHYLINKFDYLLNKNFEDLHYFEPKLNRKLKLYLNSQSTLELLLNIHSDIRKAYDLKEAYHRFNKTSFQGDRKIEFHRIINEIRNSGLEEFAPVADMLENWEEEILNSFLTYHGRRVSNGPMESKNKQLRVIIYNTNGMSNFYRERNRFMYCYNPSDILVFEPFKFKRKMKPRGKYKK